MFGPAAERNRAPILEQLRPSLPGAGKVLEKGNLAERVSYERDRALVARPCTDIAQCLEFAALGPVGPFPTVAEPLGDRKDQFSVANHAAQVPVGRPLVALLVVVLLRPLAGDLGRAFRPALDQITTRSEAHRRHARLHEGEVIAAEEAARRRIGAPTEFRRALTALTRRLEAA